jgi:pimeloyl-ACP methyl ester carboxylesterase
VWIRHPATGERSRVRFSRAAFGEVVRASLYGPAGASALPLLISEAYRGDYTGLASAHLRRQRALAREGSTGLYLAVTCLEDVPRADQAATIAASRNTILGAHRARQHFAACALWPRARRAADFVKSRVTTPVLMIVGDRDPVTPPAWARDAQRTMDSARLVVVPHGGHWFSGLLGDECLERLQLAFLEDPAPARLDAGCVTSIRPPPFRVAR